MRAQEAASDALTTLRRVVRTIHPPVLTERGLDGAVTALAASSPVPCTVAIESFRRLPAAVETAAYFAIAEALTNLAKHSCAASAQVRLRTEAELLVVEVEDDGGGGAGRFLLGAGAFPAEADPARPRPAGPCRSPW
ncbi:sensor histidine kinase [Nonomuraea sp. H19]|uniref:sensor histidine kinase n=1 Tax=Nonomuraea sp. H19 TaxID=3452206 RepID=UPI003F8C2C5C